MTTIYDYTAVTSKGEEISLSQFKGKTLLIVNTASKCGLTPQFEGLEKLNKKYKDKGLVIIGFPCNQFAHQEPGDSIQASEFCQLNYGVSFLMMKKIDVNGKNASPIFQYLKKQAGGFITNAIKYTEEGDITLSIKQKDDLVTFSVKDTGIGISRSDQKKIFQKFYRSEDYRTRETSGTGLGLYVSAKLSEKMNTKIELVSRLNHGSTFYFSLPISE